MAVPPLPKSLALFVAFAVSLLSKALGILRWSRKTDFVDVPPILRREEKLWIRPLGYAERFMSRASFWGNMSTVYALWLDAQSPVSLEVIKRTSSLIFKKMAHLRLCIGNHNGDVWWKEMESEKLDVEEVKMKEDVVDIFEKLLKKSYNLEEGPLWFIRLLTPDDKSDLVRDANFNFRRRYILIFGFHHCSSDGTTNMIFCNIFINLLNRVLQNNTADVKEIGRFAYPIHDNLAKESTSTTFLLELFLVRAYKYFLCKGEFVRNFLKHFPMPVNKEASTQILQNNLDELSTERLLKRCRMERVTLNSVFTAAANIALYRMILQRENVDKTSFDCHQAINMRRYWPKEQQEKSFGCHISMVDLQVPTQKEDISNFWEYSRKIHDIIYNELHHKKRTLKMQPLSEKLWIPVFVNSILSKLHLSSVNDSHFCITNMGDVSSHFTDSGPEVIVSKMLRSVSAHFMPTLCQHTLQTFKGRLYFSLDYYPQKMSVDTARTYASSLLDTLRTIIHMPN